MKKVIFCAGALLFGAIGFPQQNVSDLDQNGDGNKAYIDQVGGENNSVVE